MFIYFLPMYTMIPVYIVFLASFILGCRYISQIIRNGTNTSSSTGALSPAKAAGDMQELVRDSAGWMRTITVVSSLLLILIWWFCTPAEKLAAMTSTFLSQASVAFVLYIVNRLICYVLLTRIKGDPMFPKFFAESKRVSRILFIVTVFFLVIYLFLTC